MFMMKKKEHLSNVALRASGRESGIRIGRNIRRKEEEKMKKEKKKDQLFFVFPTGSSE